jgi:7-carboxy-7-deazaguanine synthase
MKINEIYFSVQGESTFAGLPCVFVRTTFCNLRCSYCDTKYSYYEGDEHTLDEILTEIQSYPTKLVELTGGEPLLQSDIDTLAKRLLDDGYTVLCETSGSLSIDKIDARVHRIVDFKTPDSGEEAKNDWANVSRLTERDEVKFVICSERDYKWSKDMLEKYDLLNKVTVLFSPEHENMKAATLVDWITRDGLNVRFQVQIHKYIWPSAERGV